METRQLVAIRASFISTCAKVIRSQAPVFSRNRGAFMPENLWSGTYLMAVEPGPMVQTMDPQQRRGEIFDAVRHVIMRAAEVRPQVVVFEDLQWMDQATQAFLTFFTDSLPTARVLCILTYRTGYVHPFGERTYHTRIALTTLSTT